MGQFLLGVYILFLMLNYSRFNDEMFLKFRDDLMCVRSKSCLLGVEHHVASLQAWKSFLEWDESESVVDDNHSRRDFFSQRLLSLLPPDSDHPDGGPYDRVSPFWCWLRLESREKDHIQQARTYNDCKE